MAYALWPVKHRAHQWGRIKGTFRVIGGERDRLGDKVYLTWR